MAEEVWTTRRLLGWTTRHFERVGVESPRRSSEMLLSHVLGVDRLKLYMEADRPASELERAAFRDLIERATAHEPVDYLVGEAPFYALWLKVSRSVLIPRPSTETVVEHVIEHVRRTPGFAAPAVADIGTGSGAIAIAIARHIDAARIVATDISEAALAIAVTNARACGVEQRIEFRRGDLLEPLAGRRVRFLVSNPPYISDEEWPAVPPNVRDHEPEAALRGGPDGLRYLRPLIERAAEHLDSPGQLVLEIAASQKQAVLDLAARAAGITNARVLVDHEGLARVLVADRE